MANGSPLPTLKHGEFTSSSSSYYPAFGKLEVQPLLPSHGLLASLLINQEPVGEQELQGSQAGS